jgi:hypothetical protein
VRNIPDYIFHNTYKLDSIEKHGEHMFKHFHLPSLENANEVKITRKDKRREDIVEELEKAHIYIYQLNERLKVLEKSNTNLIEL